MNKDAAVSGSDIFARKGRAWNGEKDSSFYDNVYLTRDEYRNDFRDSYYFNIYRISIMMLVRNRCRSILEPGCGVGVFASMLHSLEHEFAYSGFDYSKIAIDMARERVPGYAFFHDDIYSTRFFDETYYDAVVMHEVLEHLKDDIGIIRRIRKGSLVVASVPEFDDDSHIMFFSSREQVLYRYGKMIDICEMQNSDRIFVFCGRVR